MNFTGKLLLVFSLLFVLLKVNAQTVTFSGTIQDGVTKLPINKAVIHSPKDSVSSSSDSLGSFTFKFDMSVADTVTVSDSGYEDFKFVCDSSIKDKNILILLQPVKALSISIPTDAEGINFTGTIQDGHTNEPIGYASVYMARTGYGKTSDSLGNFSFHFDQFIPDTLVVSYVGYEDFKIAVDSSINSKNILVLLQRGKPSNEVVVRGRSIGRGLLLWRMMMKKKKQYNRYNLSNFSYEAYNKLEVDIKNFNPKKVQKVFFLKPFSFVFNNIDSTSEKDPFLPAYLLETVSDYSFQKSPKRYYEDIKASNTKGFKNESMSKLLGVMNQNVNVYGNYITVIDKDFIGPLNDEAYQYYNFSSPDTQIVNGKKLYHFVFSPKHPGQSTFQGDAWIMEKTYQITKISLYLGKEANINFITRISVFQEFTPVNDSIYFLTRDKFFADFNVLGKQSLTFIGRKTTSYKNIVVNSDSVTALLKKQNIEDVIKTEPGVNDISDSDWNKLRHDTLSKNELAIYTTVDKLLQMPKFTRLRKDLQFLATGYRKYGNFEIGPWFNWVSVNQWEGTRYRFDLGNTPQLFKDVYLHGYLAYGTRDEKLKGMGEAYWIVNRLPRRFTLHAKYFNDIDYGISSLGQISEDNIFTVAIRKPNITRKFISKQEISLDAYNEIGGGFSTQVFLADRKYTPLENLPLAGNYPTTTGDPLESFSVALKLRFAYLEQFLDGDYFQYSLGTRYPTVEVMAEQGIPGVLHSAYTYTKLSMDISDVIKISPYGSLTYRAYAGKVFGTLPYPFLVNLPGNDLHYYDPQSFNLMTRFQYLADQYIGINVEHNFGSGLFRFIPLTRKLKWRQFWNIKALWGSLDDANSKLNNSTNTFQTLNGKSYIEVGTGIDNILRILRLDFVWRVAPGALPTDNNTSNFGIFGSFHFQF